MSRSKKWRLEWSFFLGGKRPPQVQQDLQGLCPSLQAELPGGPHRLSPLPVRTLEKVWG